MPICGLFRVPGKVPQPQADESSPALPSPYSVLIGRRRRRVSAVTVHREQEGEGSVSRGAVVPWRLVHDISAGGTGPLSAFWNSKI